MIIFVLKISSIALSNVIGNKRDSAWCQYHGHLKPYNTLIKFSLNHE